MPGIVLYCFRRRFGVKPLYRFDYAKARSNRFAEGIVEGSLVVVLEPELAQVFKTPEQVRVILRAIADTLPQPDAAPVSGRVTH